MLTTETNRSKVSRHQKLDGRMQRELVDHDRWVVDCEQKRLGLSPQQGKKISERMQRLIEIAERDSNRRDFEIVREMHGLPPKKSALKKPK